MLRTKITPSRYYLPPAETGRAMNMQLVFPSVLAIDRKYGGIDRKYWTASAV
jgi:hypothetical protein